MDRDELNLRIIGRGEELFKSMEGKKPSVFETGRWVGRMMDWSLRHDDFRTRLLRFVDVFPSLTTSRLLTRHLGEYFDNQDPSLPVALRLGTRVAQQTGWVGAAFLGSAIRYSINKLGKQFIVGGTAAQSLKGLSRIRRSGCAFSIDILGEAVLSEREAEQYADLYISLLDTLEKAAAGWTSLNGRGTTLDWGYAPRISVSLKPSSLYSQTRPLDFEGSVTGILGRLRGVYEKVIRVRGALTIDMESYQDKDIFLEVYRRLRLEYPDYPHLGIAMQAYLPDTDRDLRDLLGWARQHGLPISIRLIKGAYWDYEIMRARQNGWEVPVYTGKAETDAAFERHARLILENHETSYLACGSHNIRSIAAVLEMADHMGVPQDRYEFQVLYGMAEPVLRTLVGPGGRVRVYCPLGPIVPGIAYLVRRLLENTANQSFLRLMFAEGADMASLLRDPSDAQCKTAGGVSSRAQEGDKGTRDTSCVMGLFKNQPPSDFTKKKEREFFAEALASVRRNLGKTCPLFIDGKDMTTSDTVPSLNPADPGEVIAHVCQAGIEEAEDAIRAAGESFETWRDTKADERACVLLKAAAALRSRRYELAAGQVLEIGKQWDQASADVAEAIDFMEYYAREMVRLGTARRLPSPPGESNHYFYEPRGVTVVIAPWNFPLAISSGMVSAAIVTGNSVVYKPSPLTPVTGRQLADAFREAGLPRGVFNFLPGRTEVIAEYLTDHPMVSTIAFTGSTRVGLAIVEKAAVVAEGQGYVKRVIAEMGGKNAIIVDADANLDEAIPGVLTSAFGFQGQKCSSCSRVIVLSSIYDTFVERLIEAARALGVGPADDPAFSVGPVADDASRARIMKYIGIARQEGKILFSGATPGGANYVPITIVGDILPGHVIAEEEIFGPVLAVMKVKTFDEALRWANSTRFALTGGVYSRSPRNLEEAGRRFRVGNLYLNRPITGALVERQPFGGFRLSGLGTKAGGPEYLLHFMDSRVVTENTARRGFAPEVI